MNRNVAALVLIVVTSMLGLSACGQPTHAQDTAQPTPTVASNTMSREQAVEIAQGSACLEAGALTDNAFYNAATGTWWIDLDADKPGCAPACVVNVNDKSTEVNWRCTGALPPAEPATEVDAEPALVGEGVVSGDDNTTESPALDGAQSVSCWGGFIKSLPAGGQFDDYLALEGEQGVGIEGADSTIAAQIQMARDQDTFVHIWGDLHCPAIDYGGCQLIVTQLREDKPGPLPEPEAVEGWSGTFIAFDPGAQYDDYFSLLGDFPARYGIDSTDEAVKAQWASFRDSGELVRVWGHVTCGVPDAYGAHIEVTRIEAGDVQ